MGAHERVVVEVRVSVTDAIDFLCLTRAESFLGIEALDSLEEPLTMEDHVQTRDAAGETMCGIEEGGIGVGDFSIAAEPFRWDGRIG